MNAIAKITSKLSYPLSDESTVNNVEVRPKFHASIDILHVLWHKKVPLWVHITTSSCPIRGILLL